MNNPLRDSKPRQELSDRCISLVSSRSIRPVMPKIVDSVMPLMYDSTYGNSSSTSSTPTYKFQEKGVPILINSKVMQTKQKVSREQVCVPSWLLLLSSILTTPPLPLLICRTNRSPSGFSSSISSSGRQFCVTKSMASLLPCPRRQLPTQSVGFSPSKTL